ncbi:MAG: transglutaminase domain-containing protein, partial [Bacteroidales bacterium]|nr:transglutaminase domain-containing protein [Bacteroidales bacterium]
MPDGSHDPGEVSHFYGTAAVRMRAYKFTQEIGYTDDHYSAWQQLTHLIYTYADPDNRYIQQLEAWHRPYNPGYVLVASDSWGRLFKQQRKNPQFWKPILKEIDIPTELQSIGASGNAFDTLAAAEKVYNYVINNITWDSTFDNHTTRSIESIIKSKKGNSAEINMTLVALMRRTGISGIAAMTSTSDFGEVDTAYANTAQFNTVLACLPYEERLILMDATDPKKQFGKVTPGRYDRVMWFMSPFKYFFGDAEYTDDKNYQLKKISDEM